MDETKQSVQAASSNAKGAEADIIVLGVGTCGEDLSLQLLDGGLDVTGIEASLVGGECPYWACLPSKMMIRAGNALQEARRVNGMAGDARVSPDWSPVASRVHEGTGGWDDSTAVKRFESRGGRLVKGRGVFDGPRAVRVGDERYTARRGIVIATGSKPAIPPIPGLSEVDYWTTHHVIQAEELPDSLLVLGGGAVGCELGQLLSRFGVAVTVIEAADRLLPSEEPEASHVVEEAFAREGIQVMTGAEARRVGTRKGLVTVALEGGKELAGEKLLVVTGRKADLEGLGLESAGLDSSAGFVQVDERMRAAEGIWAMGDVTGEAMFTHVALYQSAIIAAGILGKESPPARYDSVPRAIFTDPEVGAVGLTESEARSEGLDAGTVVKKLPATFRGWVHGNGDGVIKLVVNRETGTLAGATAAGPQAGEMLGFLTLAVHEHIPLKNLRSMIYAFPTFYGGIGEAIGAYGRGLTTVMDPGYQDLDLLDSLEERG
jgi:pyruvate/2-oxoglutarate dehydrogenase complex dihydrolipoamide dehydrogenase (E3) component